MDTSMTSHFWLYCPEFTNVYLKTLRDTLFESVGRLLRGLLHSQLGQRFTS